MNRHELDRFVCRYRGWQLSEPNCMAARWNMPNGETVYDNDIPKVSSEVSLAILFLLETGEEYETKGRRLKGDGMLHHVTIYGKPSMTAESHCLAEAICMALKMKFEG